MVIPPCIVGKVREIEIMSRSLHLPRSSLGFQSVEWESSRTRMSKYWGCLLIYIHLGFSSDYLRDNPAL